MDIRLQTVCHLANDPRRYRQPKCTGNHQGQWWRDCRL